MSRPRKPDHLKLVSGTDQPCRREPEPEVRVPALEESPEPPDWLPNAHAVKEWCVLAPIMTANRLLTDANVSALGQLCALHGKLVQLWSAGETPTGHLLAQYRNLINDFGLTPIARGRIKATGEPAKKNRFDKLKDSG
jgi:phage terminase small subunit